ncbi:MAG: fluoride efflux transporter CrcB [Chloroflexota bacterium]|nr:fluoride efflux transporter CrcB [Chloroflexota bacterium]
MELLWVGIGGAMGALGRYVVGRELTERTNSVFPYGTFTVNMIGAFLIGVLFAVLTERGIGHDHLRFLLVVGLLGGFTTFSSYTLEAISLFESGHWATGLAYVLGSNILGILACFGGIVSIRWVL